MCPTKAKQSKAGGTPQVRRPTKVTEINTYKCFKCNKEKQYKHKNRGSWSNGEATSEILVYFMLEEVKSITALLRCVICSCG